ncbi:inner-membrane translocator [Caldicellulosiruptor saccharolyticus DSM 8903]|uniref:Inner-membrane translocator n=1 Tax=Caldicellulosiruptor saccharolyticus (strain ATCC 43494 / DSM 8903 / Tp8T 6331) TaxID=351627 RepID=A4XMB6_CALS8|nr:inner-membrane translocator [Caldicellulosiruptor saccharolyticus DSM 8903]
MKNISYWFSNIFNALSVGSIYILIAMGLVITFGLMKIINMAHGEFIMLGAYTTYVIQNVFEKYWKSFFDYYILVAIPVAFIVGFLIGVFIEKTIVKRLYERTLDSLLLTWGISLILQQLVRNIFGAPNVEVKTPQWMSKQINFASHLFIPSRRLFILVVAISLLILMFILLNKTVIGLRIKAVLQNREIASALGINSEEIDSLSFGIGTGLAGVAGCCLTILGPIGPSMGTNYIIDAFMIVILGGMGYLPGVIISSLIIGFLKTFFELNMSTTMAKVLIFIIIILILQFKPHGLYYRPERSAV